MAPKKSSKKSEKVVKDKVVIPTMVLQNIVHNLKSASVTDFAAEFKDGILFIGGESVSSATGIVMQIRGLQESDMKFAISVEKVESVLSTSKENIEIQNYGKSISFKSGSITAKRPIFEFESYASINKYSKDVYLDHSENYQEFTVDPDKFGVVLNIVKSVKSFDSMIFSMHNEKLNVDVMVGNKVESTHVAIDIENISVDSDIEDVEINPKYAKTFSVFDDLFTLVLNEEMPLMAVGEKEISDGIFMKTFIIIAPNTQPEESDVIIDESDEVVDELEFEEEPS